MREGFSIGPLFVHYYGVIIMLGAIFAAWLSTKLAEQKKLDPEIIWDLLPWVLVAGIIGARVWHILTPPASMVEAGITTKYYLTHPVDALKIWRGGLGIPGAVMTGLIAVYVYSRRTKINFGTITDVLAPGLAFAQAIGRWGNFINQELYGAPTDLPWAIYIDQVHRLPEFIDQAYYHPLFFYESIWNLANGIFLLWVGRKFADRLKQGDIFLFYLVIYPFGRFMLEYLRLDPSPVGTFNANQTLMAVICVAAAAALIFRHRKQETPAELTSEEDPEEQL